MSSKSPDNSSGSTASEAIRAALERRLRDPTDEGPACVPPSVPDHVLLRRIGQGAYGDVWLARNALGTLRAVKVVYRARFKDNRPYEREFHGILKFEPVSRSHEGLVQVLHVGRDEERECFYYVMELADGEGVQNEEFKIQDVGAETPCTTDRGQPISNSDFFILNYRPRTLRSELAWRQRLPPADAAQPVLRLAGALAHLHAHGLVHRDIKPSNIIFVGGQPKLADIGLVTDVGSSHSFVGTEGFIPPEGPGTQQGDIYGLGKLLYELATGRDRMDFPQLPPDVLRLPDSEALLELNEVMTRACAPEPRQRYASATELQADLNLFLAGRSLRRARHVERALARLKRIAVAACVFLALAVGAIWFVKNEERHANERARQATERARIEAESHEKETALRQRAEEAERQTQQQLFTALLEQARATVLSGEVGQRVRALEAVRRAAAISNSPTLRGVAVAALALPDLRFERELPAPPDVTLAKLDPKFERIALCRSNGPVEIRSVADQQLLATLPASTNLPAYIGLWSLDGRFFAACRDHKSSRDWDLFGHETIRVLKDVEVWEPATGKRLLLIPNSPHGAISFHPRLPRIMVSSATATAAIWDVVTGQELARHPLAAEPQVLRFAPDGESFAASYAFGAQWMVSIHRAQDGAALARRPHPMGATELNWHPSGRWLGVPDHGGAVHLMDAETGELLTLGRHKSSAVVVEFSPDGRYLFSGGWDRELICWDIKAMQRAFNVGLNGYHFQFRADGRQCMIARWQEAQLRLHTFERPALRREFNEELGGRRTSAAFSPDGRWLAASGGQRLVVWDLASNGPGAVVTEGWETRVSFAPNGELFAYRRGNGYRWRIKPGANAAAAPEVERLAMANPPVLTSLCLLSNGVVFTCSLGSRLVAYDQLARDDVPWTRTGEGTTGVSPDERWLGLVRAYGTHLYIHRLPDFERLAKLTNAARISRFEFSPLGDEVAVANRGGVEFWSTTTWERTRRLTNFTSALYSRDAGTFWLSTDYRAAGLHDAGTLESVLPLPPNTLPMALSPDQRYLAAIVDGRYAQVWNLVEVRQRLRELGLDWVAAGQ